MAVVKIWAIKDHSKKTASDVKQSMDYITDEEKTKVDPRKNINEVTNKALDADVEEAMSYISNNKKTIEGKYVTGIKCDPLTAPEEFQMVRIKDLQNVGKTLKDNEGAIVAFHIVQSFRTGESNPEEVHQIGIELAKSLGCFQAVVSTHTNTENLHNHIIINAFSYDPVKQYGTVEKMKYYDNKESYQKLRDISDKLCLERGLSVENPDINKTSSKTWYELDKEKTGESYANLVEKDIDNVKNTVLTWADFKDKMAEQGYKIREKGSSISYQKEGNKKAIREKRLKKEYQKEGLINYWAERQIKVKELQEKDPEEIAKLIEDEKRKAFNEKWFFNPDFIDEKTKKPYKISRKNDKDKTLEEIELNLKLASAIINDVKDEYIDLDKLNEEIINMDYTYKLKKISTALEISKRENVFTTKDLTNKEKDIGKKLYNLKRERDNISKTLDNMADIRKEVEKITIIKDNKDKIDKDDIQFINEITEKLKSKGIRNKDEVKDFINRYEFFEYKLDMLNSDIDKFNERYKDLKTLESTINYAKSRSFCFGPLYKGNIERDYDKSISILKEQEK